MTPPSYRHTYFDAPTPIIQDNCGTLSPGVQNQGVIVLRSSMVAGIFYPPMNLVSLLYLIFFLCLSFRCNAFTSPTINHLLPCQSSSKPYLLPHFHLPTLSPSPNILVEGTVRLMTLFLDRGAKFEQLRGDGLIGCFENVDQGARKGFIMLGEESNSESSGAGTTGSNDLEKRQTDV